MYICTYVLHMHQMFLALFLFSRSQCEALRRESEALCAELARGEEVVAMRQRLLAQLLPAVQSGGAQSGGAQSAGAQSAGAQSAGAQSTGAQSAGVQSGGGGMCENRAQDLDDLRELNAIRLKLRDFKGAGGGQRDGRSRG